MKATAGTNLLQSGACLYSPARHQQARPWLILPSADLDTRMAISCVMDEMAVPNEHARMSDVIGGTAEKQEVAGAKTFPFDRSRAWPGGLHFGITWHDDSPAARQH